MKNQTTKTAIRIALFASFLLFSWINLNAQYKLEFEWRKTPGGLGSNISSITKSNNDNLIYITTPDRVRTIRTSDGETLKIDTVESTYNLLMSKDEKTLVASSGTGVGLLDPSTFKRLYWENVTNSDYISVTFNEKLNKYILCGNTYNNPVNSLIRIYDVNTKSLIKEFGKNIFPPHTNIIKKGWLTDDGKYVIYSMISNLPLTNKSYLKIIDLEGNVIKDFGETNSPEFVLTNDGTTLIYFKTDGVYYFDLTTMKEKEVIPTGGLNPDAIEMSNDGKFMIAGAGPLHKDPNANILVFIDFETKKYTILNDNSSWRNFKLNYNNSSLFYAIGENLYKFKLTPNTSIKEENKFEFLIQVNTNDLIINSSSNILPNYNFKIISLNGKITKQLFASSIQFNSNIAKINISDLQSGTYIIQISDNDKAVFSSKFAKIN